MLFNCYDVLRHHDHVFPYPVYRWSPGICNFYSERERYIIVQRKNLRLETYFLR